MAAKKVSKKKVKRKPVAVIWKDAVFHDSDEDGKLRPCMAITYGEIIELNDEYVKIMSEVFEDGSGRQKTAIPAGMVVNIVELSLKDPFPKRNG